MLVTTTTSLELPHKEIRAVGIGGAEGLQPYQYFRIKVVKGV